MKTPLISNKFNRMQEIYFIDIEKKIIPNLRENLDKIVQPHKKSKIKIPQVQI